MLKESVVKSVKDFLDALSKRGVQPSFGIVFGSEATGKSHEWSDIDLIVVSPHFDGPPDRENAFLLWRLAGRINSRIEPIPCGLKQWQEDDSSAVLDLARREGVEVRFTG